MNADFLVALDRQRIEQVYLPEGIAFLRDPMKHAVTEKQMPGSTLWGMEKFRELELQQIIKDCKATILPETGEAPAKVLDYLQTISAPRMGIHYVAPEGADAGKLIEEYAHQFWCVMERNLRNPGTARIMQDSGAYISEGFQPLLPNMPGNGVVLECAYGRGMNVAGKLIKLSPEDPMYYWAPYKTEQGGDKGLIFSRDRNIRFGEAYAAPGVKEITIWGGGWLPELRYMENQESLRGRQIYVCDIDTKIPKEILFDLPAWLQAQVQYSWGESIENMIKDHASRGIHSDVIAAKGVLSFMPAAVSKLMAAALRELNPGGKFIFDLQVRHYVMLRDIYCFAWAGLGNSSGMHLMQDPDEAIKFVQNTANALGKELKAVGVSFGQDNVSYEVLDADGPFGVIFTITK